MLKENASAAEEPFEDIARDISGRKKEESPVRDGEARYHSFFEHSKDSLFLLGTGGQILEANPAACAAFQMTEAELCNLELNKIVDITDPGVDAFIEECRRVGNATAEIRLHSSASVI